MENKDMETVNHVGKYRLFILMQCLIWGLGNPLTKFIYVSMTPFCYMAFRFSAAATVLLLFFWSEIKSDLDLKKLGGCVIASFFMGAVYILANLSFKYTLVTIAGFLNGIPIIFTTLISIIFLKKKIKPLFLLSVVMVIIGMYLLCCGGSGGFSLGIGEIFALTESLCLALALIINEKVIKNVQPVTLSTIQCLVTALICLGFALTFEDFGCLWIKNGAAWMSMLYMIFGCTIAAFMLQNVSSKHLSPMFISLAFCTEPIFTAIFSYIILKEKITWLGFVGSALIIISVVLATISSEKEAAEQLKQQAEVQNTQIDCQQ